MLLVLLFINFLLPNDPVDPSVTIANQANLYISNISDNEQADINFWGLNELYSSNCGINKNVSRIISQSNSIILRKIFSEYECDSSLSEDSLKFERFKSYALKTGSVPIAVHYISQSEARKELEKFLTEYLELWEENISEKQSSIIFSILNRENISLEDLPESEKQFIIYSLLFSDEILSFFNRTELQLVSEYLNSELKTLKGNSSFNSSFLHFNLLKIAYESNNFKFTSSLFEGLMNSIYYPNSEKKVGAFSGFDYSLIVSRNYSESLYLQRNVLLPLAEYYKLKPRVDYILLQQGYNFFQLGKYESAKAILEGLYNDPNSNIPKSQLYNNLSLCYQRLGQKNKYTSFLLRAIQEAEKNETTDPEFYKVKLGLYRNLFVYYNSIGDTKSALPFIDKAMELSIENNNAYETATIHFYLGNYYWDEKGDYITALEKFELAEEVYKKTGSTTFNLALLIDKADILISIDSLGEAKSVLKAARDIASRSSDTPKFIETLIFESEIASAENNLSELGSILNEIKIYSLEDLEFEVLVRYHNIYAEYLHKQGKNRAAYAYYKPKLDQIISRAQGSVDAETGFWTVEKEYLDAFEIMISILRKLGNDKESITYLDKLKTINDASLYNNILLKAAKLTEQELTEEKKLTTEIQSLRSRYLSADEDMKSALKTEIDKLSAQKQLLVNKVSQSKNKEEIIPVWMIQQQISTKELVLHFTELNDQLYVSRITKNSASITGLDLTPEISRLLNSSANGLAVGQTSLTSLYDIFEFLRLDEIPDDVAQITVIPDNELYRLPLDILPTKPPNSSSSFGSTRYMIEDYSFKYFTSLQDYAKNNRNYSSSLSNDFSAFAISYFDDFTEKPLPSLPYATQEVREIKNVLTEFEKKKVFAGNTATEQAFQEQLATSRILHVATHSEVSVQDPLFSTIYLKSSKSNGNRGDALYAYELFDNQLKNELIMLNSCSSGNGNYLQGTGIMGISRALRFAGSKSLALNLWEVNDKIASEFATSFYSYMNKGLSKSAAMRLAKIDQLKTGSADPHYWGAYTLIGNPSPIIKKPSKSEILLPLMIVVGLLIGYKVRIKDAS